MIFCKGIADAAGHRGHAAAVDGWLPREVTPRSGGTPQPADKMGWVAGRRRLRHDPPDGLDARSRERLDQLAEWGARGIEAVAGNSLLRTGLHPLNILVADRARVIDRVWSRPAHRRGIHARATR